MTKTVAERHVDAGRQDIQLIFFLQKALELTSQESRFSESSRFAKGEIQTPLKPTARTQNFPGTLLQPASPPASPLDLAIEMDNEVKQDRSHTGKIERALRL